MGEIDNQQYRVTSNIEELAFDDVLRLVRLTDWAKDRREDIIRKSFENSLNFGVFAGARQVGYCRVITDYATFAYLADVIIEPDYRGRGLSMLMMEAVMSHPELNSLRRMSLLTTTAHDLYRKFGFENLKYPMNYMEVFYGDSVDVP